MSIMNIILLLLNKVIKPFFVILEVAEIRIKQNTSEALNRRLMEEKHSLTSQVQMLSMKIQEQKAAEVAKYKEINQRLENENTLLRHRNLDLEDK